MKKENRNPMRIDMLRGSIKLVKFRLHNWLVVKNTVIMYAVEDTNVYILDKYKIKIDNMKTEKRDGVAELLMGFPKGREEIVAAMERAMKLGDNLRGLKFDESLVMKWDDGVEVIIKRITRKEHDDGYE